MSKLFVTQVITALTKGGAESMLCQLLAGRDSDRFDTEVIALSGGPVADTLRELGVEVTILAMPRGVPDPRGLWRLLKHLRRRRPDAIQTWLYHADLIGGLAGKWAGRIPVAWGIHNTTLNPDDTKWTTVATRRLCARKSWTWPRRIVCCSEASRQVHTDLGYDASRMVVIPNGFDLTRFTPQPAAREAVRASLGLPLDTPLVGLVARFDAQKDHRNFLAAAAMLQRQRPEVRFVLCGRGVTAENQELADWIAAAGVGAACLLLGERNDIPWLLAGFDVACSSSVGEAFPMAVGEAMAAGTPCVATDVGDTAFLVGDTGRIVPPQDSAALAAALGDVLALTPGERTAMGAAGRQRVATQFSLPAIVERYQSLWTELAAAR